MTTIDTRLGAITGTTHGDVSIFRGIRFAEAPVGQLRFKPPVMTGAWEGTLDATTFGNRAIQADSPGLLGPAPTDEPDEDCLFLNIYTPAADEKKRPVLFWIHGGAFILGSGHDYNGSVLSQQGDVVVVTINYRLGLFGFLDLSAYGDEYQGSGNNGIADQICALEWVSENIADYGGDPDNITIFGESAGAMSVNAILAAPRADDLYHKAISHSGGSTATPTRDMRETLSRHLDVSVDNLPAKLASMSSGEILKLQQAAGHGGVGIDGVVITRSTYEAIADRGEGGVPYIAGSNLDEGTLFSAMIQDPAAFEPGAFDLARGVMDGQDPTDYIQGLKDIYGDDAKNLYEQVWVDLFRRPSTKMCAIATSSGRGGWLYRFDLPSTAMGGIFRATHACEIPFTFNTFADDSIQGIAFHDASDPVVRGLAASWSNTVIAFAKTGNPNGAGLPEWPTYDSDSKACLVMDTESRIGNDLDSVHEKIW